MADTVQALWGSYRAFCHGGWMKADQDFGGRLIQFLREVNEAIAA
jgi:hypothetical protein